MVDGDFRYEPRVIKNLSQYTLRVLNSKNEGWNRNFSKTGTRPVVDRKLIITG
jgi:hypothetical protein